MSGILSLAGRRILVTGGSRGVGAAVARLCAAAGADVAITYHTRAEAAEGVVAELRGMGRSAVAVGGDHADPATVTAMFEKAVATLGGLDGFVANAGIWPVADVPVQQMSDARWSETLRVNLDGVFVTTREALRHMTSGSIVLVSSTAGQRGEAGHADYAATKGALISMTKSLAVECGPAITVNCLAPGWIETEMSAGALQGPDRARIEAAIPLRRVASPEDTAGPIVFLLSSLARHVTGEILNVNGGSVLCG